MLYSKECEPMLVHVNVAVQALKMNDALEKLVSDVGGRKIKIRGQR